MANWGALPGQGRRWADAITHAARSEGIDPALLAGLVWAESSFNANARSHAGAIGLAQLMPGTARGLGVNPNDPIQNLRGGARYLRQQLDAFGGNVQHALAAYNAGPGRVRSAGGIPNIRETQNYVPRVLNFARQLGWGGGAGDSTERMGQRRAGQGAQTLGQPMGGWESRVGMGVAGDPQLGTIPEGAGDFGPELDQQGLERMVRQMFERSSQIMAGTGLGEGETLDWARPSADDPIDEQAPSVRDLIGPLGREGLRQALEQQLMQPGDLGVQSDGANFDFEGTRMAPTAGGPGGGGLSFLQAAQQFEGVPYLWGGTTPRGFDCSGIIQYVLGNMGVRVPRVSRDQARTGENMGTNLDNAMPGDLVAFPARGLSVGHIGIYAGRDSSGRHLMLHAPRSGRSVVTEPIGNRRVATIRRLPQLHGRTA